MKYLICLGGPDAGEEWPLTGSEVIIGRSHSNQVPVNDYKVSRQHCRLSIGETTLLLSDMGSRNGTKVDGQLIKDRRLNMDQFFQVGDTLFVVSPKRLASRVAEILHRPENDLQVLPNQYYMILFDHLTRTWSLSSLKHNTLTNLVHEMREANASVRSVRDKESTMSRIKTILNTPIWGSKKH